MQALQIIQEEHRNMWRIATTIDLVSEEVAAGGSIDSIFFNAVFDYIEQFVDKLHHPKEDDFLFARLRQRNGEANLILSRLEAEHANSPKNLQALRADLIKAAAGEMGGAEFSAGLRRYTDGLRSHIRCEEKDLAPLALQSLTTEDWTAIDTAFLDHADPLFGTQAKTEFRELYHRIVALAPESIGLGAHAAGELQPGASPVKGDVLLDVRGLESCYGRIKALKGIDIEVRKGETVALVGANGAGKTTFLRCLSGVQPTHAGAIWFDCENITSLRSDLRVRQGICQSPEGRQVFGPLSIEDNLKLGAYAKPKVHLASDLERIYSMFPVLKEKRHLPAGTLSGGQQQMLAIGRALMGRPKLLLLDEPSMGLAPLLVEEVFNVVRSLKDQGMTIILAEQNAFSALALADRAYVLETGRIILSGSGQELIHNELVKAAYLGM